MSLFPRFNQHAASKAFVKNFKGIFIVLAFLALFTDKKL